MVNRKPDVLEFIKQYRSHEVLWNMNIPSYRRNDLRYNAYQTIADDMKMSLGDVKRKIKSLRTAYSAEKNKVEKSQASGSSKDPIYTPTVCWYDEMAFLNDTLLRRPIADHSYHVSNKKSSARKKKRSSQPKRSSDDSLHMLTAMNEDTSVSESCGENVVTQIKEFPEEEAYQLRNLLSQRKMEFSRKDCEKGGSNLIEEVDESSQSINMAPVSNNMPLSGRSISQEEFAFTAAMGALKNLTNAKKVVVNEKDEAFSNYIKTELNDITNKNIKDQLMETIILAVFEAKAQQRQCNDIESRYCHDEIIN